MLEFPPILTALPAARLLAAVASGERDATVSLNLGRAKEHVAIRCGGVVVRGEFLPEEALARIAKDASKCFEIVAGEARPIVALSAHTGWVRTLLPTADAPTTVVAGFPMHRIRHTTPLTDSRAKARALGTPRGVALDTATGLGYTAIELAKTCTAVVTVEVDPTALELATRNPWSAELFASERIRQVRGDVTAEVASFEDGTFSVVLHDPPTVQLAGELYSLAFYRQLRRVLKPGGRLFHYVGDPDGRSGRRTAGVMRRLAEAGFVSVRRNKAAHGVTATVPRDARRLGGHRRTAVAGSR